MSAPRLQIDLNKIIHNASTLVSRLQKKGISVTGVTKAFLGAPLIARAMLRGGVTSLGDSRIENIETMRRSGIAAKMILIRSPMLSQVERVVKSANVSVNTEIEVLAALSVAAVKARRTHGVILMVELGDLREGFMPRDVKSALDAIGKLPNLSVMGLGANLACRNGVAPDDRNMAELSALATRSAEGVASDAFTVSGGNSSNLGWVFSGGEVGRINNLRLGESILLGREALNRQPIRGLFTDAFSLVAEVIESKIKPSKPWGTLAQSAFGEMRSVHDRGDINQAIVAIGRQDVDPDGLRPPDGIQLLDASSDHLILSTDGVKLTVGSEISFDLNYSALLRAMTSPHIAKSFADINLFAQPRILAHMLPDAA